MSDITGREPQLSRNARKPRKDSAGTAGGPGTPGAGDATTGMEPALPGSVSPEEVLAEMAKIARRKNPHPALLASLVAPLTAILAQRKGKTAHRDKALEALSAIAPRLPEVVAGLLPVLNYGAEVGAKAGRILRKYGESALPAVAAALASEEPTDRLAGLRAVGWLETAADPQAATVGRFLASTAAAEKTLAAEGLSKLSVGCADAFAPELLSIVESASSGKSWVFGGALARARRVALLPLRDRLLKLFEGKLNHRGDSVMRSLVTLAEGDAALTARIFPRLLAAWLAAPVYSEQSLMYEPVVKKLAAATANTRAAVEQILAGKNARPEELLAMITALGPAAVPHLAEHIKSGESDFDPSSQLEAIIAAGPAARPILTELRQRHNELLTDDDRQDHSLAGLWLHAEWATAPTQASAEKLIAQLTQHLLDPTLLRQMSNTAADLFRAGAQKPLLRWANAALAEPSANVQPTLLAVAARMVYLAWEPTADGKLHVETGDSAWPKVQEGLQRILAQSDHAEARAWAALALVRMSPSLAPQLVAVLGETLRRQLVQEVRAPAAETLGGLGAVATAAVPQLEAVQGDASQAVRVAVVAALRRIRAELTAAGLSVANPAWELPGKSEGPSTP